MDEWGLGRDRKRGTYGRIPDGGSGVDGVDGGDGGEKAGVGTVDGGHSARYECSTQRRHTQPLLPHAFRVASEAQTAHTSTSLFSSHHQ